MRTLHLGRHAHEHQCPCGSTLHCVTADCAVGREWQCPACDQQQQDEYFEEQRRRTEALVLLNTVSRGEHH